MNGDDRLGNMRNHTATHLLNAALRKIITVTYQKSSHVTESSLVFDFSVYGETFNVQNVVSYFHLEGCIIRPLIFCYTFSFEKRHPKIVKYKNIILRNVWLSLGCSGNAKKFVDFFSSC